MRSLLGWWKRRRRQADGWQEEIESHLALRAEWNEAQGLAPADARRQARRQFGNSLANLEAVRAVHVRAWMETLVQDARYALRGFRKAPAFSAVAIATMAIGVGAATAVFSVVDPLLFRSLPYPKDDQLVSLGFLAPIDTSEFQLGGPYLDWRDRQNVFQSMTSMRPSAQCDLLAGDTPQRLACYAVEANFLKTFGVAPLLGSDFTPDDDRPGAPTVVLLSYGLWQRDFGGDPQVLGRTVTLDEERVRIAGVLPRSFEMPQLGEADILLPERLDARAARLPNSTIFLRSFARLRDGVSIDRARQALRPLFQDSVQRYVPAGLRTEVRLAVRSLRERRIHDVKLASQMLLAAVLALLLLACANVANLLLARTVARQREWALRMAIGAGRGRLTRQILTESLLLGLTGGVMGCAAAWALLRLFVAMLPEGLLRLDQARIDPRVLLFALAVSLLAALLFGLAPALERPHAAALAGGRATAAARTWFRRALVTVQVALSLMLLTGAVLFLRSLWKLEAQPLGLQPERLVTASFTLHRQRDRPLGAQAALFNQLEARLSRIPGVAAFALSDTVPPSGAMGARPFSNMRIAGHPPLSANGGMVGFRWVTPGYFQTMGIRILSGRPFAESERTPGEGRVILSASLARRMFGAGNPLGQRVGLDDTGAWTLVVGVAADVKNNGLSGPADPEYYRLRPRDFVGGRSGVASFRTSLDSAALSRWIRREFAAVDPTLPVTIESMESRVARSTERPRFLAALVALFALFGLALAAIGLYGVLSFLVAQRTREIGIRMALGARPRDVALQVQGHAAIWAGAGVAAGLAGSLAFARMVRGLLFEVPPGDPVSLAAAVMVLAATAVLAAWLPAHRAARTDPVVALRQE